MHDAGQQRDEAENDVKWLALVLRRVGILIVTEVERRYDLEPSLRTKRERQRRGREQRAA